MELLLLNCRCIAADVAVAVAVAASAVCRVLPVLLYLCVRVANKRAAEEHKLLAKVAQRIFVVCDNNVNCGVGLIKPLKRFRLPLLAACASQCQYVCVCVLEPQKVGSTLCKMKHSTCEFHVSNLRILAESPSPSRSLPLPVSFSYRIREFPVSVKRNLFVLYTGRCAHAQYMSVDRESKSEREQLLATHSGAKCGQKPTKCDD